MHNLLSNSWLKWAQPLPFQKGYKNQVQCLLDKYLNHVENMCKNNPTYHFWSAYLDMVAILLLFLCATREGLWGLHLSTLMLPWYFAYDGVTYARYLQPYIAEMENLQQSHEKVDEAFMDVGFVVQRQPEYGFSGTACDQVIEQTLNRDSKTKGGMTGITRNKGAVNRWILSHHERAAIAKSCRIMAGIEDNARIKRGLDKAAMQRESCDTDAIKETITSMVDPFSYEGDCLINITSGVVASKEVQKDLLGAYTVGKSASQTFCTDRIERPNVDLFTRITCQKLKTFANTGKQTVTKVKCQTVTLKSNSQLFSRLLMVGQTWKIDLHKLLAHALTNIPTSLATYDGLNVKTNKATLMHQFENTVPVLQSIPPNSAVLVDGMACCQMIHTVPNTFGELAVQILNQLVNISRYHKSSRVNFVIDRYPEISIKNCERTRRASAGVQVVLITRPEQKTPGQFRKYLSSGQNMANLTEFLFQAWKDSASHLPNDVKIFVCHGDKCHSIQKQNNSSVVTEIPELECDQEEADTRLLLHTQHASLTVRHVQML